MSTRGNMTFTDTAPTPATITMVPKTASSSLVSYIEEDATKTTDAKNTMSFSLREGKGPINRKVTAKITVPYQPAPVNGVVQPLRRVESITTYVIPVDADAKAIADLQRYTTYLVVEAQQDDIVKNGIMPL